jgi:YbbR domain-containing protein
MQSNSLRQVIARNLIWFVLSLILAIFAWITAVQQSDPFEQRRLPGVPLRVNVESGLIITNEAELPPSVSVLLDGQRNALNLLTSDDVVVTANLNGLEPGTHTVPLTVTVARDVNPSTIIPSQITVDLEVVASQQVPLRARIDNDPPPDMEAGEPQFDVPQVEVSGPQSLVEQVVRADVPVDLTDQRETFEDDERPIPVDADGDAVAVTVSPQIVHVTVPISQSENVREVNVSLRPEGELPEGYFLTSLEYEPKTVFVSIPSNAPGSVPNTLFTTPIDLSGRTGDFVETVSIDLSGTGLVPITETNVTVTVGIATQTATAQIDAVNIEQIGGREEFIYRLEPAVVSLIITAPQPVLEELTADDVRVTVDLSGLGASGTYTLVPVAALQDPNVEATIAVLPVQIDVAVESRERTPEATLGP